MSYYEKPSLQISKMTDTPQKREELNALKDSEKLRILHEMTDTNNIVEILDFIKYAYDDAAWCNSYR